MLTNVRVHSGAASVAARLERAGNLVRITVADDGRGFDLDAALARARRTNHLGLESMMERVDAADGTARLATTPGEGTIVEITQPLWPEE